MPHANRVPPAVTVLPREVQRSRWGNLPVLFGIAISLLLSWLVWMSLQQMLMAGFQDGARAKMAEYGANVALAGQNPQADWPLERLFPDADRGWVVVYVFDGLHRHIYPKIAPQDQALLLQGPHLHSVVSRGGESWDLVAIPAGHVPLWPVFGVLASGLLAVGYLAHRQRSMAWEIERRHAAEQERTILIQRMAEVSRLESLGTLAGGVAHEINTPAQYIGDNLLFIQGWLPRLLDVVKSARDAGVNGQWDEVRDKANALKFDFAVRELPAAAQQAIDGIGRIASIVQAIKEFSFPSAKTPHPFDLNHSIENACMVTRNRWKYVAEIRFDPDPSLPPLEAVEGEINQVLVNLIVNAADAIAELDQKVLGHIDISTALDGEMIQLTVADSGIGISPEHHSRLFELFFTTKAPGKGTGQGLAITRAIILRHGGSIDFTSTAGQGACFIVRLPVHAIAEDEVS